jgi:hypothetical protein
MDCASGDVPSCRNNQATEVVEHLIYLHGGHDGTKWLNDLHILDTTHCEWIMPLVGGELPAARACHSLSKIGRKLFLFGGYDGVHCFNELEVLDLDIMIWMFVPGDAYLYIHIYVII